MDWITLIYVVSSVQAVAIATTIVYSYALFWHSPDRVCQCDS
jgi:hypothetical protein